MSALFKSPKIPIGGYNAPDNSEYMEFITKQQEQNNKLYAQRQAEILTMEEERGKSDQANALLIQQQEQDLLAQAQAMEQEAQQEDTAMAFDEDEQDVDNIITGFYGSLWGGQQRPE